MLLIAVNGLIGQALSPSPAWVTLPVAMQFVGLMAATIPASMIMAKIGRKRGFYLGNLLGIIGAGLCAFALQQAHFMLFCTGTTLLGVGIGFGMLYRFAAVEACAPAYKHRAISLVMLGGVIAAVAGPALAVESQRWIADDAFTGAFIGLTGLYIVAMLLLTGVTIQSQPHEASSDVAARPLGVIVAQPMFVVAVVAGMASYAVMNLLMTATPLAMARCGFSFPQTAWVIEWHVLGMFLPSFFTGRLIQRFGAINMIQSGGVLMLACIAVNLTGQSQWHFWTGLFLLGLGWNFMFISATGLVTETYRSREKAKTQATNEFLVFSMVTLSALSSGWLETRFGWTLMNQLMIPVVIWAMVVVAIFARKSVKVKAAA